MAVIWMASHRQPTEAAWDSSMKVMGGHYLLESVMTWIY